MIDLFIYRTVIIFILAFISNIILYNLIFKKRQIDDFYKYILWILADILLLWAGRLNY